MHLLPLPSLLPFFPPSPVKSRLATLVLPIGRGGTLLASFSSWSLLSSPLAHRTSSSSQCINAAPANITSSSGVMDEIITIPPRPSSCGVASGCLPARFGWLTACPLHCAHLAFLANPRAKRETPAADAAAQFLLPHRASIPLTNRRREFETFPSLLIYLTLVF